MLLMRFFAVNPPLSRACTATRKSVDIRLLRRRIRRRAVVVAITVANGARRRIFVAALSASSVESNTPKTAPPLPDICAARAPESSSNPLRRRISGNCAIATAARSFTSYLRRDLAAHDRFDLLVGRRAAPSRGLERAKDRGGRNLERRHGDDDRHRGTPSMVDDSLADPRHPRGPRIEKKRHVRAQRQRDSAQPARRVFVGQLRRRRHHAQNRGGVARSAAEPGADRDLFLADRSKRRRPDRIRS